MVCDMNQQTLKKVKNAYPQINVTSDVDELINSPEVDAIAIATPVFTHHEFAKKALECWKECFYRKTFHLHCCRSRRPCRTGRKE